MYEFERRLHGEILDAARGIIDRSGLPVVWLGVDYLNSAIHFVTPNGFGHPAGPDLNRALFDATGVVGGIVMTSPSVYPFSTHLGIGEAPTSSHLVTDSILELVIRTDELQGLASAYATVKREAEEHDFVATFAMGGVPALLQVTEELLEQEPVTVRRVEALQRKYHLFPGLSWDVPGTDTTESFRHWAAGLPEGASVLLVDTTFTGNAVDKIVNELTRGLDARCGPVTATILGIIDRSRAHEVPDDRCFTVNGSVVRVRYIPVPRIVSEDQNELLGFDAVRRNLSLRAVWYAASLRVEDAGGNLVHGVGTSQAARAVREMLKRGVPTVPLRVQFEDLVRTMNVYNALENARRNEHFRLTKAVYNRLISTTEAEEIMQRVEKQVQGAYRRFGLQ